MIRLTTINLIIASALIEITIINTEEHHLMTSAGGAWEQAEYGIIRSYCLLFIDRIPISYRYSS